jgi:glutathione synthase/RimK-type ligase-like ATP-grasp enzyme
MIITRYSDLIRDYHRLAQGDVFVGQVPASPLRSSLLLDLTVRGVRVLPSATAQMINGSKITAAHLLHAWMLPHTHVVQNRKDLMAALQSLEQDRIKVLVTKADNLHCGQGVCKWDSADTLYSCVSLQAAVYPFVLQPFVETFTDLRVVMVGDFCEAYSRSNEHGFRKNLAAGGVSRPHALSAGQQQVCRDVMQRAGMPYAHIDLMITPDGGVHLSEIRLNGGIHGAQIDRKTLDDMKQKQLMTLAEKPL